MTRVPLHLTPDQAPTHPAEDPRLTAEPDGLCAWCGRFTGDPDSEWCSQAHHDLDVGGEAAA